MMTQPVLAFVFDLGRVGARPVTRQVIVAYDEIYAIKYFGQQVAALLAAQRRHGGANVGEGGARISTIGPSLREV